MQQYTELLTTLPHIENKSQFSNTPLNIWFMRTDKTADDISHPTIHF